MKTILAIETSSDEFQITIGRDGRCLFDSSHHEVAQTSEDIGMLVESGLAAVGAVPSDINAIALNIGPGGLTYVRAGVAFANAFAYALGIPIFPFNHFEIIANQAKHQFSVPIICAIPAANNNAYVGLLDGTSVRVMRFGTLPNVASIIIGDRPVVAVAGRIRDRLLTLRGVREIIDTGIEKPDANALLELGFIACEQVNNPVVQQVDPLNDQSGIFYE